MKCWESENCSVVILEKLTIDQLVDRRPLEIRLTFWNLKIIYKIFRFMTTKQCLLLYYIFFYINYFFKFYNIYYKPFTLLLIVLNHGSWKFCCLICTKKNIKLPPCNYIVFVVSKNNWISYCIAAFLTTFSAFFITSTTYRNICHILHVSLIDFICLCSKVGQVLNKY